MNFAFSEEQEELRRITRQFLESKSPESEVRRLMDTDDGYDPAVWSQMANELGLQSLIVPEEFGGQGFTFVELTVVLEEMGRALLCAPYFSSAVLATSTLLHAGDDAAKKEHLPGMAAGETIATLAFTEPNGKWDESGIEATATKSGDGWSITGTKMFVLDGNVANLLLVAAKTDAGVSIFAVDPTDASVTRTNLATMDQTRKQSKVELAGTPATLIGTDGAGWTTLERVLDLAAVALAAEQVGGAQKVLETAVQYAKDRVQFGRPIGSFQAIKHKCADMLLEVESAKSAAYYAAWCAAELNDELPSVASLAKAYCSEAYFHAAAENIQIHGGIGFTWEHPAHLYFKRAKSSELLFGDPTYHRELLAQRIGIWELVVDRSAACGDGRRPSGRRRRRAWRSGTGIRRRVIGQLLDEAAGTGPRAPRQRCVARSSARIAGRHSSLVRKPRTPYQVDQASSAPSGAGR